MRRAPIRDLKEQLARKSAELSALREISRAISSALDLDTTLTLITRKTAEVMGMDSCSIYLLDPQGEYLVLRATTGLAPEAVGRARLRYGEGLTGWAAKEGKPVASSDAASDPRFVYLPETEEYHFKSLLAVPLVTGGKVLGAINVQTTAVHEYTEEEVELLSLIADMASGALEKAMLYDNMRRQIMELSTLAEISKTLTSPLYLEDVLKLIMEMAAQMLNARLCSLMLLDEEKGELVLTVSQNASEPYRNRPNLKVGEGIAGLAAQTARPIAVYDVLQDPRFVSKEMAAQEGLRGLLAVPLIVRDRVIGVFNCYKERPHHFTEEEVRLASTLANQMALAIENANLVVKSAVVREMHHRVKNNLQTIAMLLRLQMRDGRDVSGREVLIETINRILSIAAVHEILSVEGFKFINIREMLEKVARTVAQNMARPDLELRISVRGDEVYLPSQQASSLALVVNELIQNAIEHAFKGQAQGSVEVNLTVRGDRLFVEVRDDGVGLPVGFDPATGSDLGLQIVRALVAEDLKGEFVLERCDPGTKATITLPKPSL
jgi:signal transduction protein with GAF and PtsI domain